MYKIVIEEITTEEYESTNRVIKEERPLNEDELCGYQRDDPQKYSKKIYEDQLVMKTKETTKKIYEQSVPELDIVKVIGAINGL